MLRRTMLKGVAACAIVGVVPRPASAQEGLKMGIIRSIHLCERLLRRPQTTDEELMRSSLDELTRLYQELQEQVLRTR